MIDRLVFIPSSRDNLFKYINSSFSLTPSSVITYDLSSESARLILIVPRLSHELFFVRPMTTTSITANNPDTKLGYKHHVGL